MKTTRITILALIVLTLLSCAPLRTGYILEGTVTDSGGAPLSGVRISIEGASGADTETDGSGRYVIQAAPYGSWHITASLPGYVFAARRSDPLQEGAMVFLGNSQSVRLDFLGADSGSLTVPMIQGRGFRSPFEGQSVRNVVGVITQVTRKAPHAIYDTILIDGSTTPQWVSEDGFFMEAFDSYKDGDPLTSDGVFVYTHNDAYVESKWLDSVPSDLAVGDVVSVSGVVREFKPADRFGNSEGFLTFTRIEEPTVLRVTSAGVPVTRLTSFPAGVLLTYDDAPVLATVAPGSTEWRTLPWGTDASGELALRDAALILESVEGMVVRVNNPLVSTSTYYNVTGILADGGQKGAADNPNLNSTWKGVVLQDPSVNGMDFNPELLFCDYQKPNWATFNPIPQTGDTLKDAVNNTVLRGVVEYTFDALYMIKPLQNLPGGLTAAGGSAVPNQGWNFNVNPNYGSISTLLAGYTSSEKITSADQDTIRNWRIGSGADARFRAPAVWGPTPEADFLKVGSFNIENFQEQGTPYDKDIDIADIIVHNMRAPDVVVVVEMGDDHGSTIVYENQDNSYAIPDGIVTSVLNFRQIITAIKNVGGPQYDFRCIDPEENRDGGEPGTNIRVGFLYRTDTVTFVDRGLPTNHLMTTGGLAATDPESAWAVTFPSALATALATQPTAVSRDPVDGQPMLTQSPGRIIGAPFAGATRKPLAGEFIHNTTGEKFFVIAAHLGSKRGDTPLYGQQQPPVFGSDARRTEQGAEIAKLVAQILDMDPNANVVVAGDMNDFPWAPSMRALKGLGSGAQILWSPSEEYMPRNEQFSYAFRGNLQQIDNIYATAALLTGNHAAASLDWLEAVFISHIDSPFSKNNHIQSSDHDAVVNRYKIGN
ncbi:MAG: carboxypeptidase regulatory-like domain-containing protein [Spirochaetales bacterium]|nr:carboxypeptidase regulatory-like domain-containing protein [Spirochaetales bacterium]